MPRAVAIVCVFRIYDGDAERNPLCRMSLCRLCQSPRQRGRQECIKRALTCSPVRRWGSGATSFTHGLRFPLMLCVTVLVCTPSMHQKQHTSLRAIE